MAELIAIREYARRKGCSDTNVRKAIKAGKIVNGVVLDRRGKPSINPEIADLEWKANFDPTHQGPGRNQRLRAEMLSEGDSSVSVPRTTKKSLADIKRDTADIKLRMAAIELQEKMGKLVDKEKVYKALFSAGQEVRTTFQSIPDRVIDEVLSAPSRNEAHGVLFDAIADALEKLSEILNREINT